mmetsp:Transcript_69051/g.130168  ORF Transcript_69051/g.130168 Transcript_69051/m.130168 type:complete len:93 (+) Transcript_69051:2209-2487(+)
MGSFPVPPTYSTSLAWGITWTSTFGFCPGKRRRIAVEICLEPLAAVRSETRSSPAQKCVLLCRIEAPPHTSIGSDDDCLANAILLGPACAAS